MTNELQFSRCSVLHWPSYEAACCQGSWRQYPAAKHLQTLREASVRRDVAPRKSWGCPCARGVMHCKRDVNLIISTQHESASSCMNKLSHTCFASSPTTKANAALPCLASAALSNILNSKIHNKYKWLCTIFKQNRKWCWALQTDGVLCFEESHHGQVCETSEVVRELATDKHLVVVNKGEVQRGVYHVPTTPQHQWCHETHKIIEFRTIRTRSHRLTASTIDNVLILPSYSTTWSVFGR